MSAFRPLAELFKLLLARLPAYLLRPEGVNPWADRLAEWWLAPLSVDAQLDPISPLATPVALEHALSAGRITDCPALATGYLGRSGERFVLGGNHGSLLGAAETNRPPDGVVTIWGDLFRRFPPRPPVG